MTAIYDDEILGFFIEESQELIVDLKQLGGNLKKVGIPNEEDSARLSEFAQKLNRLIGGTASMGFEQFTPLSRKTSLLAARCAEIREMTIRLLIVNMNIVVNVLDESFSNLDSVKNIEQEIYDIDKRIDICMSAVDLSHPDIKSQDEIDSILNSLCN
ncbi:MAG: hypothetical protein K4571_01785 [Deltaproteobacteria bacterium]